MTNRLTGSFHSIIKKQGNTAIVILVDGSGSINSRVFDTDLRQGLDLLTNSLLGASVSIIQFASTTKVEAPPTKDITDLKNAIKNMRQLTSATYTKHAVEVALKQLSATVATTKLVFIITDGDPAQGQQPDSVIAAAPKDVTFFAIGVGANVQESNLRAMSTNDLFFRIDDFAEFRQFADLLAQNEESITSNPIIAIYFCPGPSTVTGDVVTLELDIENLSANPTPKGMQIHFMRNTYFEYKQVIIKEALANGDIHKMKLKFMPQATGNDEDFPGKIEFKVTIGNITQLGTVTVPTGILRGDFTLDKTLFKTPINVMVLGRMGSGKSALLNALITCLSMSVKPAEDVFFVAPRTGHVTTEYKRVSLNKYLHEMDQSKENVPLYFYDCWGFSPEDYKTIGFQEFLRGKVKLGTKREGLVEGNEKAHVKKAQHLSPDRANEIHVVVMVTPIASYMEASTMERLNEALEDASSAGYNPILVVTNIDTVDDAAELEAHKVQIMRKITIDPRNIYYHKNYFNDKIRNIEIDLSSRMILRAIWSRAKQKHLEIGKKIITSIKYPVDDEDEEEVVSPKKKTSKNVSITVIINGSKEILKLDNDSTYRSVKETCIEYGMLDDSHSMVDESGNPLDPEAVVDNETSIIFNSASSAKSTGKVAVKVTYKGVTEKFIVKEGTTLRELREQAREDVFVDLPERGPVRQDGAIVNASNPVENNASYSF